MILNSDIVVSVVLIHVEQFSITSSAHGLFLTAAIADGTLGPGSPIPASCSAEAHSEALLRSRPATPYSCTSRTPYAVQAYN